MDYHAKLVAQFGLKIANIATGSATPGCDLVSLRDQGEISSHTANAAAHVICGASADTAARRECDFCRAYDI